MTIWERVVSALTPLGLPLAESVLVVASETELPNAYIVFFVVTSNALHHANNVEILRERTVQITYFNRTGLAGMPDIQGAMVAAGFTAAAQRELPYNQQTGHFGYALDFNYVE